MKQVDEERFSALLAWASAHGGTLHPALEVYKDDVTGYSMRVKPATNDSESTHRTGIQPQDEILSCPLQISLSYMNALQDGPIILAHEHMHAASEKSSAQLTTQGTPAFPPEFMALPPHIISRFYLIKQYLLGPSSFWYPYIATLPQPDALSSWILPPFWPETDACLLQGTNTGIAAEETHDAVRAEYKQARRVLKSTNVENWRDYTSSLHTWAFSMFASRSFRPSLVVPPALWDAAVAASSVPHQVALDDFSVLLPVFDIINHSMQAQVRWLPVGHESESSSNGPTSPPACRFQTFDTYHPGQQIFNSYGSKTNSELLLSYGFVLPETEALHNDYVHLRKKATPQPQQQQDTPHAPAENALPGSTWASKPQDFLVSLRPMNHPSSLAGTRRQWVAKDPGFDIQPAFAHVEDSLVWDLCLMVVGEANKAQFINKILGVDHHHHQEPIPSPTPSPTPSPSSSPSSSDPSAPNHPPQKEDLDSLHRILSPSATQHLPPPVPHVLTQVKDILLAKLGMEYDKICEADPGAGAGVDEDEDEHGDEVVPQTSNQALALAYRGQAKKVLENAIAALVPDWQPGGEDGED